MIAPHGVAWNLLPWWDISNGPQHLLRQRHDTYYILRVNLCAILPWRVITTALWLRKAA